MPSWHLPAALASNAVAVLAGSAITCGSGETSKARQHSEEGVKWLADKAYFGPNWLTFPATSHRDCAAGAQRAASASSTASQCRSGAAQGAKESRTSADGGGLRVNFAPDASICAVKVHGPPVPEMHNCPGVWTTIMEPAGGFKDLLEGNCSAQQSLSKEQPQHLQNRPVKPMPAVPKVRPGRCVRSVAFLGPNSQAFVAYNRPQCLMLAHRFWQNRMLKDSKNASSRYFINFWLQKSRCVLKVPGREYKPRKHTHQGLWACMMSLWHPSGTVPDIARRPELQIGSWRGTQINGTEGSAQWLMLPKFLSHSEVQSILKHLPPHEEFDTAADSIDGEPAYEFYSAKAGMVVYPKLDDVMRAPVSRVLPFIRQRFDCASCDVCFSLIRRYLPGERRQLSPHQDLQAHVSVVFALNAEEFDGGLYLMANHSAPRRFLSLATGDAVVHQADLLHGVSISRGDRWSWSLWIKPEMECKLYIRINAVFTKMDVDQDRRLSLPEFVEFAVLLDLLPREKAARRAPAILLHADENRDGYLDLKEVFTMIFESSMPDIAKASGPSV